MRYAILSDIHSNLEAFSAVLESIAAEKPDQLICLGDIVGYGASPKECLDLVRAHCHHIVIGNHDHAVLGLTNKEFFNPNAKKAVEWTAQKLGEEDFAFLKTLPVSIGKNNLVATHATLSKPTEWGYILDEYEADACFSLMKPGQRVTFIGHSHIPLAFENGPFVKFLGFITHLEMNPQYQYVVNVGSVGQPRDNNNLASYALYDSEKLTVDLVRVPYDIPTAQKKILDAGLPPFLAERIQYGR